MRENGTLNYSKVYIVNPGTPGEATYTSLTRIKPRNFTPALYVAGGKEDNTGCNMSIIDSDGNPITKRNYNSIGNDIHNKNGINTILVTNEDNKFNLLNEKGHELLPNWYDGLKHCSGSLGHLCIIEENGLFGLADLHAERIIAHPRWLELSHIRFTTFFKIVDKKTDEYYRWGIMDMHGNVIHVPKFTDYFHPYRDWDIFNKVTTEKIPTSTLQNIRILNKQGEEIFQQDCIWCKRCQNAETDSAERAFLFASKFSFYGDSLTTKLVIFSDDSTENPVSIQHLPDWSYDAAYDTN